MAKYHQHPLTGHLGVDKTIEIIRRRYRWVNLNKNVRNFVSCCQTCQTSKISRAKSQGLLQPLPIADAPWQSITMDFIVKLPQKEGYDSILVVVDRFTKMAHFIPTQETCTAGQLAALLWKEVFKLHGLPRDIVSDRGSTFMSKFWIQVLRLVHIKPKFSTAYHPQTDG